MIPCVLPEAAPPSSVSPASPASADATSPLPTTTRLNPAPAVWLSVAVAARACHGVSVVHTTGLSTQLRLGCLLSRANIAEHLPQPGVDLVKPARALQRVRHRGHRSELDGQADCHPRARGPRLAAHGRRLGAERSDRPEPRRLGSWLGVGIGRRELPVERRRAGLGAGHRQRGRGIQTGAEAFNSVAGAVGPYVESEAG